MSEKSVDYDADLKTQPEQVPAAGNQQWPWMPATLARLSQGFLAAKSFEDVLKASLETIYPSDVSGVTLLLGGEPLGDEYVELVAAWPPDDHSAALTGTRFNTQDYPIQSSNSSGQTIIVDNLATDARVSEHVRSTLLQAKTKALVMLPLEVENCHFGAMLFERSHTTPFNAESVRVFEAVAALAQPAIEKLWLIRSRGQALSEISALYRINQQLMKAHTINDVLETVLQTDLFGAAGGTIALLEPSASTTDWASQQLVFWATAGVGADEFLGIRMPASEGVVGWVVREGQPAIVRDVNADERFFRKIDEHIGHDTKSILCAPLRVNDRVIGAIELVDVDPEYLNEEGIRLLSQVADQAALLIQNQRLQTSSSLQETTLLYQASQALTQAQNLDEVLHALTHNLPLKQIDQCWIALIDSDSADNDDPKQRMVKIRALWDHEGDVSLLERRFASRELPFVGQADTVQTWVANDPDTAEAIDAQSLAALQTLGIKSALSVPLATADATLGWLVLITHHHTHIFDPDQIRPYQTLADQAAMVIRNQQLLQQVQASLEEVETVHRRYLRSEWASFLRSKGDQLTAVAYDYGELTPAEDLWHPLIERAISRGSLVAQTAQTPADTVSADAAKDLVTGPQDQHKQEGGTSLVMPLKVRGQVIGALGLEDPEQVHEWTTDELSMVEEIAERVAQAIENARLLDETQTSLAETEHLYAATGRLSDANTAADVIKIMAEEFFTVLAPTYGGSILRSGPDPLNRVEWLEESARWDADGMDLTQGDRFALTDFPAFDRFVGRREAVIIKGTGNSSGDGLAPEKVDNIEPRTIVAMPLVAGDSWLGVSMVISKDGSTPDSRTMRFLQNLADRAAIALESVRLYLETQQRAVQLEAASRVSRAATSILQQDTLLSSVVELIRNHFGSYQAQVFLLDPGGDWAVLEASSGEAGQALLESGHAVEVGGPSLIGYVTGVGEPQISRGEDGATKQMEALGLPLVRSELAIPLRIGHRVIGAVNVQSTEPDAFGSDDIPVLSTLADQLAIAIENARLYQEQLETAEKLREVDRLKSQFLANMSHELRTPLNSIIGFSRVILKGIDGPLTDLQQQDLTAIYNSGKLLLRLINDVLDISKIAAGKMELTFEQVDLTELIRGAISTATALVKDKPEVELRQNIPDDLPIITADSTRLRQVLLNLMSNGVKFTENGYVELNATHDDHFVTIKVIDTGVGIPADKFDLVFQEFEQVDGSSTRAVGGTGLGLPISRHFVEMHGGHMRIESEVGVGSTFTVQLPIKGPYATDEPDAEFTVDSSRRLILAVDDDADVISLYRRYLEKQNYQVLGISNSEEALQRALELQPFAILLDLLMPKKDGWAVIQELKSDPLTRDIPVIMCSIVGAAGRGFSLGAADFLTKPIDEDRLLAALARLENGAMRGPEEPRLVLIIDDTPEDRQLLRRTLEAAREPFQIIEATGGLEGVEIIQSQRPDLVVLDLMMPEMDGFAVLESLKSDKAMRQIPIIIVTAKDLTQQERARINGQVAALFRKGLFREEDLLQDLNLALRRVRKNTTKEEQNEV